MAVVVPVYNVEAYLKRCVDSILEQTYRDFTLVLVDDGSGDNSGAMCDRFAAAEPRIRVIHQRNGGLSAARNAGLDLIERENSAEYVTFIDSDDTVSPVYLEALVSGITNGGEIAATTYRRVTADDRAAADIGTAAAAEKDSVATASSAHILTPREYWNLDNAGQAVACAKLFPVRLFHNLRFPVGKCHEDELTTYKLLFAADRIALIEEPLYDYLQRGDSITGSVWTKKRLDRLVAWREQIVFFTGRNYPELVDKSRRLLVMDLVTAIIALKSVRGEKPLLARLRTDLRGELKTLNASFSNFRLAYKAAYPFAYRFFKLAHALRPGRKEITQ